MTINDFTEIQREALFDLAVLAMYSDGHLAAVEDAGLQRLLAAMGLNSDYDRGRYCDAAVSRVSRHSQTADAARAYGATLAEEFSSRAQRLQALDILNDIVASDRHITLQEGSYLAAITEALRI
jgi:uncharacterized tellurite resistance protein B-like protein